MIAAAVAVAVVPTVADAKKQPEMSSLQLQQMQTREVEAPKDVAFGAVMTVLQDSGYRIEAADKDTGLITGIGSSKGKLTWAPFVGFGKSKKSPIVSAFIESYGNGITRVRLNFVMAKVKSSLYGSQPQDEEPIYDSGVYQDAFEKINQNVFLRLSMVAPAVKTAPEHTAPATVQQPGSAGHVENVQQTSSVSCVTC